MRKSRIYIRTLLLFCFAFLSGPLLSTQSSAQDVELREKFGSWSLYCLKQASQSSYGNCSLTNGTHASDNPDRWIKVALALVGPSGDVEMTVRTPFLKYLKNGISLGFDGRQAVKAFVDTCSLSSCDTIISMNDSLMDQIATRHQMSIEYQVEQARSVVIVIDLAEIRPALRALEVGTGLRSEVVAMANRRRVIDTASVLLERRAFASVGHTSSDWKAPLKSCRALPKTKVVLVSQNRVEDEDDVIDWAEKSSKCDDTAVWVRQRSSSQDGAAGLDRAPLWSVFDVVRKVARTGLVPPEGDDTKVAVAPLFSVESPFTNSKPAD